MFDSFTHPLNWFREPDWDHHRALGRFGMSYEFYAAGDGFHVRIEYPFIKPIGFAESIEEAMKMGSEYNSKSRLLHLLNTLTHNIKSFIAHRKILGYFLRKYDIQYKNIYNEHVLKRFS